MKNTIESYGHPFATAPMGSNGSKMAVVDFQGKVYKVRGLRVVDASIFPDAVSASSQSYCYHGRRKDCRSNKEDTMMDGIQVRLTNRNILRINLLPDLG